MTNNKTLNLVIDTNVFLVSFSSKSQFHWFYKKFRDKEFTVSITNEILTEYEEKFTEFFDSFTAKNFIESLLTASNVFLITPYYNWNLIDADPDDNKFVDCAVASGTDYIITHDKHFNVLKSIDFPVINILKLDDFEKLEK